MATRSEHQGRGLKYQLQAMSVRLSQRIAKKAVEDLRAQTNILAEKMDRAYEEFFSRLHSEVIGEGTPWENGAPFLIKKFMGGEGQWRKLTGGWMDRKAIPRKGQFNDHPQGFYQGLTGFYGRATSPKRLGRRTPGSPGLPRLRGVARPGGTAVPFEQFIRGLARNKLSTERFFGPLEIQYEISKDGRTFRVTTLDKAIEDIDTISEKTGKLLMFPKEYSLKTTVTAFPQIRAIEFAEWYIVDYMLKRIDPVDEKQWVKINSRKAFGKKARPLRAMITPLISWYFNVEFARVMREFQQGLK